MAWEEGHDTHLVNPFRNLLITPWSSRVCIVQGIVMAPKHTDIIVMRGSFTLGMERIALAMSTIYKYNLQSELGYRYPARFCQIWGGRIERKHRPGLLQVVVSKWWANASDPRDKIYALSRLAFDAWTNVDYDPKNTVRDVYMDFARNILSRYRNPAILGALSAQVDPEDRLSTLPSWVPDWRSRKPHTHLLIFPDGDGTRGFKHFIAAGKMSTSFSPVFTGIEQNRLQLEGHVIDTISIDGPTCKAPGTVHDMLDFLAKSVAVAGADEDPLKKITLTRYGLTQVNSLPKKEVCTYRRTATRSALRDANNGELARSCSRS